MVTGLCHHLSMAGGFIGARMGAAGGEQGRSKPFLPSALHHPRWGWGLCRGILTPTRAAQSRGAGAERDVLDPRVQPRGGAAQLPPPGGTAGPSGTRGDRDAAGQHARAAAVRGVAAGCQLRAGRLPAPLLPRQEQRLLGPGHPPGSLLLRLLLREDGRLLPGLPGLVSPRR